MRVVRLFFFFLPDFGADCGLPTPYYNASHARLRALVRRFVDAELTPNIEAWEEAEGVPREIFRKAYEAGVLGAGYPVEYGGTWQGDWDVFHDVVKYAPFV